MSATGDEGFTLLEMLVTLAVVGLVSSIGFPMLHSSFDRVEFDRTVAETRFALRSSRALAIGRATRVRVVQMQDGSLSAAGSTFSGPLPKSVTMTLPPEGVSFFPGGEALPGEVIVRSRRSERRLVVRADGLVE